MKEYLLVHSRLSSEGGKTYVTELRASFVALLGEEWPNLESVEWTPWVLVHIALGESKNREMIEVNFKTMREIIKSRLDLVQLMEEHKLRFDRIVAKSVRRRRELRGRRERGRALDPQRRSRQQGKRSSRQRRPRAKRPI